MRLIDKDEALRVINGLIVKDADDSDKEYNNGLRMAYMAVMGLEEHGGRATTVITQNGGNCSYIDNVGTLTINQ